MHHRTCSLVVCCALSVLSTRPIAGQQWTRFRGPNGSGQSDAATIPVRWTTKDYNWRVKLPGIGHSSPVVRGDRVLVTCAIEEDATQIIRCLRTSDGGLIWKRQFESSTYEKNKSNSYAAATPAVDKDHVYLSWTTPEEYTLLALDQSNGRVVWRRNLGPFVARHGSGASPILFDDMVIVPNDQAAESSAIAVDRTTGETRWKAPRRTDRAAYATPCIWRPEGGPPQLILASSAHGLSGLDPYSGQPIWELGVFKDRVVASPVVAAGLILASAGEGGSGKRFVAVRPGNPAGGIEAEVVYDVRGSLPYVCMPVAYGDLLFLWYDQGVVTCLDLPAGKIHWRERIGGNYFGSPVRVADRIYCMSRKGEMVVLAAADKFKLLARFSLEEPSHSTPAIADGVMYLRTFSHLMAIGGKKG